MDPKWEMARGDAWVRTSGRSEWMAAVGLVAIPFLREKILLWGSFFVFHVELA